MVTHEHNLVRHFHHRVITIDQGELISDSLDTDKLPEDYSKYEAEHPDINAAPAVSQPVEVTEQEKKEIIEEITHAEIEIDDDKLSEYYLQPNSDAELEKFIENYGVSFEEDTAEDDIDYSIYLESLTNESAGGNE